MKTGIELIAAERQRQISDEGFAAERDDVYVYAELSIAAATYALPHNVVYPKHEWVSDREELWPWDLEWWKPTPENRLLELVKAGALIAAEIDRLQRLKTKEDGQQ